MDIKRFTTALLGFPLVAAVLIFGNVYIVDIAFAIIAIMSLHEYFDSFKEKAHPVKWIGYILATLIAFIHVIPKEHLLYIIASITPISILVLFVQSIINNKKTDIKDIAITFFGICYIGLFLMFIPLINGMENGKIYIWFPIIAAWGTDIFGYLTGKAIGKHKFTEISPNKTIEGCMGGTIGAVILMLAYTAICNQVFHLQINYLYMLIISIILSVIGQIGDLAASSIKRYNEIKDFSNLIPGHGGMLDRIDSVIFIAPFAYMLLSLL